MLYLDYEREWQLYQIDHQRCENIITEMERLFDRTQPKGVQFDKEKVQVSHTGDQFAEYLIEKERKSLDHRLEMAQAIMAKRKRLLESREEQLRASKALYDRIYCMRFLDHMKVSEIAIKVSYSESQVYRIMERIIETAEHARKCERNCDTL